MLLVLTATAGGKVLWQLLAQASTVGLALLKGWRQLVQHCGVN
jgi:hypothetical protein